MKWHSYCLTCGLNLAVTKPISTTSLHGSVVETFAKQHVKTYPDHVVIIGYRYELPKSEDEITFNNKGVAHHG